MRDGPRGLAAALDRGRARRGMLSIDGGSILQRAAETGGRSTRPHKAGLNRTVDGSQWALSIRNLCGQSGRARAAAISRIPCDNSNRGDGAREQGACQGRPEPARAGIAAARQTLAERGRRGREAAAVVTLRAGASHPAADRHQREDETPGRARRPSVRPLLIVQGRPVTPGRG